MHRVKWIRAGVWVALLALASACDEDQRAIASSHDELDLAWPDNLQDVDCRGELGDAGLSDAEYWNACGELDELEGGPERADELYRRYMWRLFGYFVTPPYAWRSLVSGDDTVQLSTTAEGSDAPRCVPLSPESLDRFRTPVWQARDWLDKLKEAGSTPAGPKTMPVWDQNGNLVHFEVVILNRLEYHDLADRQGQAAHVCEGLTRSAEWGTLYQSKQHNLQAAAQLKLAWRTITSDAECEAYDFATQSGKPCAKGEFGLVAMHIVVKSSTQGDYWLWGTFSHESNVDVHDGLAPLFRDPTCGACQANTCPPEIAGVRRTQIQRVTPLSLDVIRTKQAGKAAGVIRGSMARYDLVGVQRLPAIIVPNAGLTLPRPALLANELLEWDRQTSSCIGCHSHARVAAVDDFEHFCKSCNETASCQYCTTDAGLPGACDVDADDCERCRPVRRKSTYRSEPNSKPYAIGDLTWIFDHAWKESNETL